MSVLPLPFFLFYLLGFGVKQKEAATTAVAAYKDSIVTEFFRREEGLIAADNAISVPLSNGKVFWNFGDSYIDAFDKATGTVPCLFQVRNAAFVQPTGDWNWRHTKTLTGAGMKSLFKNNPDDKYFIWPACGIQLKDTMYMYLSSLMRSGDGAFDFKPAGNDLWGKVSIPDMKVVKYTPLPIFNDINFGIGYVQDKNIVYAFGYKSDFVESNVYVAQFSINNPDRNWKFWNGTTWDTSVATVKPIAKGASNAVSMCKIKNKYVLFSSEFSVDCDMGKKIYVATADSPMGPFTQRKEIYSIHNGEEGHTPFFYSVFPHPEYINEKNELLITYCINGYGKCLPFCKNGRANPDYYRAQAVRVPLKLIDAAL